MFINRSLVDFYLFKMFGYCVMWTTSQHPANEDTTQQAHGVYMTSFECIDDVKV